MYNNIDCIYYQECSAPLCPMLFDEQNVNIPWYPTEEICPRRKDIPDWVRQQRKVRDVEPENLDCYFTLEMLKVPFRTTNKVTGLNPDKPLAEEDGQLEAWHQRYKGTGHRELSEEQREKLRKNLQLARKKKKGKKK